VADLKVDGRTDTFDVERPVSQRELQRTVDVSHFYRSVRGPEVRQGGKGHADLVVDAQAVACRSGRFDPQAVTVKDDAVRYLRLGRSTVVPLKALELDLGPHSRGAALNASNADVAVRSAQVETQRRLNDSLARNRPAAAEPVVDP